jgi:hypothetical protein
LPAIAAESPGEAMQDVRSINPGLRFEGAANVAPLADRQIGPTCGFEALENIIQLFHPLGNDLVERDLLPRARMYGACHLSPQGEFLDPKGYIQILVDYGIASSWYQFDAYNVIVPALMADHVMLAIGDAHFLGYAQTVSLRSWHAFVITNFYTDMTGTALLGFVGIDSNVEGRESAWAYQQIANAVSAIPTPLLISASPIRWPNRARSYRQNFDGSVSPQG